jgi:hypothetical protein
MPVDSRAAPRSPAPLVAALAILLLAIVSCARFVEPPQDLRILVGLERLAADTDALFASLPESAQTERLGRYDALAAQSAALVALAEARTAAMVRRPTGDYADATAGFLADYDRNLARLAEADAGTDDYGPPPGLVALRRAAMNDALTDALIYERDILNRAR